MRKLFALSCLLLMHASLIGETQKMVVNVDIADLRKRPERVPKGLKGPAYPKDIGAEDSQLCFCESVLAEEVPGHSKWLRVSTQTQKKWDGEKWIGYPGFILRSCLVNVGEFPKYNIVLQNLWTPLYATMDKTNQCNSLALGTRLEAYKDKVNPDWWAVIIDKKVCGYLKSGDGIYELTPTINEPDDVLREKIVQAAYLLLSSQTPYVWGGMSPLKKEHTTTITGADCSGLAKLSYLASGLDIPRDANDQSIAANPLKYGKDLKKADLIFFARLDKLQISHVMVYVGDGDMVESYGVGGSSIAEAVKNGFSKETLAARRIKIKTAIGFDVDEIESGKTISKGGYNGQRVFLGTYFGPNSKLDILRAVALGQRFTF